jgi:hypothetical protein
MAFTYDPFVNLVLTVIILVLGVWGYRKSGRITEALVGGAFGIFALSHLLVILGVGSGNLFVVGIRIFAYLVMIYALYRVAAGHTFG